MKDRKIELRLIFLSEIDDRKERKKVEKLIFKTNVLVPKTNSMRKEEGATVDCRPFCHLPSLSGPLRAGRTGSVLHRRIQISGKLPLTTTNVLPSTRIAGDFQTFIFIDSPKQMNKYKDADESDKNISDLKHRNVNDTNNNCS